MKSSIWKFCSNTNLSFNRLVHQIISPLIDNLSFGIFLQSNKVQPINSVPWVYDDLPPAFDVNLKIL